jgi:heptosyltransferase-2
MLHRLVQRQPGTLIDVLAPPWTEKLLRQIPEINDVLINPFPHGALQFFARRSLGKKLSFAGYDQAIVLPNSWKSALVPFFAGIPRRTGFTGEVRYGLLNDARKLDKEKLPLMVQRFSQLAEDKQDGYVRSVQDPHLQVSKDKRAKILSKFKLAPKTPVAVFCPGAEFGPSKRWPEQYYAELAQSLRTKGYTVWLIGSPNDQDVAEKIVALGNPQVVNLCGKTDLGEAITLISCADIVISNDSGLMHIAAALGRPLVALFGSSSPRFTPPLSEKAQVLRLDLPCSPCFKRVCPLGHFKCMLHLTPPKVSRHIPIAQAKP